VLVLVGTGVGGSGVNVAVGIIVLVGTRVPVAVGGGNVKVGETSGREVSVGLKIAVIVRSGVGNMIGVGVRTCVKLHAIPARMKTLNTSAVRFRFLFIDLFSSERDLRTIPNYRV
jgi:hypothetical protein